MTSVIFCILHVPTPQQCVVLVSIYHNRLCIILHPSLLVKRLHASPVQHHSLELKVSSPPPKVTPVEVLGRITSSTVPSIRACAQSSPLTLRLLDFLLQLAGAGVDVLQLLEVAVEHTDDV